MRIATAVLAIVLFLPWQGLAAEASFRYVKAEKAGDLRVFTYECLQSGILIQMQQRHNQEKNCEEVRFDGVLRCDTWQADIHEAERFEELVSRACYNTQRMQARSN